MGKTYFIDSENVGDSWISLLATSAPEDELLVFYTAKSPHMNYKNLILLKESPREVTFIECCEGCNALDFQLCTELGYRVNGISDGEFIIVSNDTGFDAVVKYWKQRNIPVRRVQGKACSKDTLPAPAPTEAKESVPADPPETQKSDSRPVQDSVEPNAKEILYIVGKDNLQVLHESLQQIFGAKRGKAYYNAFKTSTAYNNYISRHSKLSLKQKQKLYCTIVFESSDSKLPMPEDFPEFVIETWRKKKNLNSFRSSLQTRYGKEMSDKYYALIRAHVKILDKIK